MSLYRKYRPRVFGDMVGQRHIVTTLQNAARSNRVAHAYLFTGPRGTGKTTTARLLAKTVNCVGEGDKPCGQCRICTAVDKGRLLDLIEIDAASNNGVDQAREIRDRVALAPSEAKYKVYIIDEAHMLTNAAFNALLKTLEEPPGHVIFVLATTEPEKIPDTIISRCQRHEFQRISLNDTVAGLAYVAETEGITAEPDALALIARRATGSMRDALGLLEQSADYGAEVVTADLLRRIFSLLPVESMIDMADTFIAQDAAAGLALLNALIDKGARAETVATQLIDYIRLLLLIKHGQTEPSMGENALAKAKAQAKKVELDLLLFWLAQLTKAASPPGYALSLPQLPLEIAIATIAMGEKPVQVVQVVQGLPRKEGLEQVSELAKNEATQAETPLKAPPTIDLTLESVKENWKAVLTHARRVDRGTVRLPPLSRPRAGNFKIDYSTSIALLFP